MNSFSNSLARILLTGGLVVVFCFVSASYSQAQSDKDRPFADVVKPSETVQQNKESASDYASAKRESVEKVEEGREQIGYKERSERDEREVKSEAKSTLSFNLFLYVIDRFKEH
ncbi:MAG: hypothetical protein JJU34_02190 [Lunatimonas sp.]|uniref:hypothetical protein n=1 Tax=Lunatimonas sp. TaxID=2060141 RepID=UPI00263AE9EE|nr:hypothetical protein [Lunatimonas sp.]MCC5936069.1 hypothetical protein [Lunatimonas sp.]